MKYVCNELFCNLHFAREVLENQEILAKMDKKENGYSIMTNFVQFENEITLMDYCFGFYSFI